MRTRPVLQALLFAAALSTAVLASAADPPLPVLHGADIPAEPSERPKEAEWKQAKQYSVTRGETSHRCDLFVVREWLRVACKDRPGLGLVAGDPKGVKTFTTGPLFGDTPLLAVAELPLARGSSRIFTIAGFDGGGYEGLAIGEDMLFNVTWRPGDENPVLAIYSVGDFGD